MKQPENHNIEERIFYVAAFGDRERVSLREVSLEPDDFVSLLHELGHRAIYVDKGLKVNTLYGEVTVHIKSK